ncbi:ABC transporter substrate-binding protein [Rhodomicrobium lacus]|uniref:ABC transporter substrate-binding protein n=1 Tax=Rhodomicrobium lacus TaxID=2498452 RepID=UPI0013E0E15A|nr:ABC transporter substrate-binding protein [Rhodomicrobium lacus]
MNRRSAWPLRILALMAFACFATAAMRAPVSLHEPTGATRLVHLPRRDLSIEMPFRGTLLMLPPLAAEYFLATDAPETASGLTHLSSASLDGGLISKLYPRIAELSRQSRSFPTPHAINLEAVMKLDPGTIMVMSFLAEPLERIGLPALPVMLPGNEQGVVMTACVFAAVAGRSERCKTLQASWQASFDETTAITSKFSDRPRVLAVTVLADGSVRAQGPSTLTGRLIERAGGTNIVGGSFGGIVKQPMLSAEQVLSLDPDVILISASSSVASAAAFVEDPRWRIFRASRLRRVYREPEGLVLGLSGIVETPIRLRWMAELFHPRDLAPKLRVMAAKTYASAVNFHPSEAELDRILSVAANVGMADSGRFSAVSLPHSETTTP